jgi:xanthine dehydrogenase YagS FAD-binding subunit
VKVRDRASFAFALASAAVALDVQGGRIRAARVALGGVGTKPWRSHEAEAKLVGQPLGRSTFTAAASAALQGAQARPDNRFKVELAQRTIVRALEQAGGAA